jgi:hypothetical protein
MMKAFIAELKGKKVKKSIWSASKKKAFEDELLDKIGPSTHSIESVVTEIENTWVAWKDRPQKFERARNLLSHFCKNIGNFKAVFDLIPSDNMYTSTLYGALTLLIHVRLPTLKCDAIILLTTPP